MLPIPFQNYFLVNSAQPLRGSCPSFLPSAFRWRVVTFRKRHKKARHGRKHEAGVPWAGSAAHALS
jgi:hypothetical protein